jgi:DNA polymerase III delta subunit
VSYTDEKIPSVKLLNLVVNKFFTGDDTKTAVKNSHAGRLDTLIYFFKFIIMQTLQNMHTEHMYKLIKNIEKTNIAYKLNK